MQMDAFPETEQQTAFIESAHFGGPKNSYTPIGQQSGEYEIFTEDPLSLDDISSDPTWKGKTRFAPGKGKSKARGKGSKGGKGKMNATSPLAHTGTRQALSFQNLETNWAPYIMPSAI